MRNSLTRATLWSAAATERAALADDLAGLHEAQWAQQSLCGRWVVEEVVAHLTAAASVGALRWFGSVLGARFDFDLHNARRLAEYRGATPAETLERFQRVVNSTTSAPGPTAAWLGEVVVHAQDIRRPLGFARTPAVETVTEVARFYSRRDFTVAGRSTIEGLRLEATDGPFTTGAGPIVSGTTLALTMVMAGRGAYCDDLTGPGVSTLRDRCSGNGHRTTSN
ncbi:maleylpyruvate isomerase family mycothiol-dependent enzyme [Rhodococcus sp. PAM 2766]|uniref:Maleylpyruvate isomerase family mycothiol-dependent enzyme n=1 Tax=Rhodococcus parequi TaxID=3137122 RepID=A0ABW9F9F5_9NOCA